MKFYKTKLGRNGWDVVRSDFPGPPCDWTVTQYTEPPSSGRVVYRDRYLILFGR